MDDKVKLLGPIEKCLRFYTKHAPDCSAAEIACSCGLSQLKAKAERELIQLRETIFLGICDSYWHRQQLHQKTSRCIHWKALTAE